MSQRFPGVVLSIFLSLFFFFWEGGVLEGQQSGLDPQMTEVLERGDTGAFVILAAERWRGSKGVERARYEDLLKNVLPWMEKGQIFNLLSGRLLDLRETPSKKIFLLLSLKGGLKPLSESFLRGFKLGISGGIRYEVLDVSASLKVGEGRIKRESPALIVGPLTSRRAALLAPIVSSNLVPVILPTQEDMTLQRRPLLFLLRGGLAVETEVLVEFAMDSLGLATFVSLVANDAVGLSLGQVFSELVRERGGEVLWSGVYEPDSTSFPRLAERIKELDPEGIFLPQATKNSLILASEIRINEVSAPFLGLESWSEEEARKWSGRGVDSVFVFAPSLPLGRVQERAKALLMEKTFRENYISRYEEEPPPFSREGYDTARLISNLFSKRGFLSSFETWDALNRYGVFSGISGRYLISKDTRFIKRYRLLNGKLRRVR